MEVESSSTEANEWEDEIFLLVELKGLPNAEEPIPTCRETCAILGIDTPEPMLQFDQYLFKGSYEDIIGTAMIFEHKGKKLNYVCKTNKKLTMSRMFLKNKESTDTDIQPSEEGEAGDTSQDGEGTESIPEETAHAAPTPLPTQEPSECMDTN